MKPSTYAAAAIASFAWFVPVQAEAARCPAGYIYRPSANICQLKGKNLRYSRTKVTRSEARRSRIEARREARKARLAAAEARRQTVIVQQQEPEPVVMQRTPMWDVAPAEQIAASPFGGLIAMPETDASRLARWAVQNGER